MVGGRARVVIGIAVGVGVPRAVPLLGDPHDLPDARRSLLPQPTVLGRVGHDHADLLRPVRLDVPADPVLPVRARLLAAEGGSHDRAGGRRDHGQRPASAEARRAVRHQAGRRRRPVDRRGGAVRCTPPTRSCRRSYSAALVRVLFGLGMGFTSAPATESIMGSLPPAKAGVGSAVNDTTRQTGGALGRRRDRQHLRSALSRRRIGDHPASPPRLRLRSATRSARHWRPHGSSRPRSSNSSGRTVNHAYIVSMPRRVRRRGRGHPCRRVRVLALAPRRVAPAAPITDDEEQLTVALAIAEP